MIRLIVDSTCDMPEEWIKRYGIRAISLMGNAAGLWDYIKGV